MANNCPQCGAPYTPGAAHCQYCGEPLPQQAPPPRQAYQQPVYQAPPVYVPPVYANGINPLWPLKSKVAAGLLALFLGGLGIHKFYLNKAGQGVVYLLFCWTGIPAIVGFIEGIIYLCTDDQSFMIKNQVRLE